jgi:tetratricopeptide (TPR) repeat protein
VYDHGSKGITWSFGAASPDPSREAYQQLQQAEALRLQGHLDRALTLCQPLVARYPEYYGALYTLGLIYADKNQYPQALGLLMRAVMLNPRSWQALTSLSGAYLTLGASEMAAQILEQARAIKPDDPAIFATLAEIYRTEREYELAYDAFEAALKLDPKLDEAARGLGQCSMHLGRYEKAAAIFQSLVRRGNRSMIALSSLTELPKPLLTLDLLAEIAKASPEKNENKADFDIDIAVVKAAALDRVGKAEEAWPLVSDANRSMFAARQKDAQDVAETQRMSLAALKDRRIKTFAANRPAKTISLFILGPSRSGKTVMEALIGTLEGVKRGYENPIVENAIRRTFQNAGLLTERAFDDLPPALDAQCREIYLDELTRRAPSAKVFTNTHPARIYDAARMAAAFPGVRFLFVKRDPDDNLLRIFMRRYARGNSYSYSLKAAREHIAWYHEMIDLLAEKLPPIARIIRYEDMVADPRGALQVCAELCGLPMTDAALPDIGDDRGCAAPYLARIKAELAA